jgi:DNA-binding NarL/FixJ family response regulator
MTRAKVFIVDDHALIIQGLTAIVQQTTTLTLVGTASTAEQFLAFLERSDVVPDVCVVDVEMPGMGGMSMIPAVKEKYPAMKIIVLTMHDQPFYRNRAIKSGADAFLLKSFSTDEFVSTIQQG